MWKSCSHFPSIMADLIMGGGICCWDYPGFMKEDIHYCLLTSHRAIRIPLKGKAQRLWTGTEAFCCSAQLMAADLVAHLCRRVHHQNLGQLKSCHLFQVRCEIVVPFWNNNSQFSWWLYPEKNVNTAPSDFCSPSVLSSLLCSKRVK